MNEAWLDQRTVARFCITLVVLQILIALINLAYIPSENREREAWRTHIESPEPSADATAQELPIAPVPAAVKPNLRRETLRFAKQQLDLDRECNFTTWFSSAQAALVAFAAFMLASKNGRRGWLLLAIGFLYFSIDELCQLHEWFGTMLSQEGFRIGSLGAPYPWVVVLGPIFLIYAIGMFRFLWRELREVPRLGTMMIVGMLAMAASLPLEALGGELQGSAPRPPRLEVIAEETLESLGGTMMLYVLLSLLLRSSTFPPPFENGESRVRVRKTEEADRNVERTPSRTRAG